MATITFDEEETGNPYFTDGANIYMVIHIEEGMEICIDLEDGEIVGKGSYDKVIRDMSLTSMTKPFTITP